MCMACLEALIQNGNIKLTTIHDLISYAKFHFSSLLPRSTMKMNRMYMYMNVKQYPVSYVSLNPTQPIGK